MAIIRREDGAYFCGYVNGVGVPFEAVGPYATEAEARQKWAFERIAHQGALWPDAPEQDFDEAHPDAEIWSTQNGDGDAIALWKWEVIADQSPAGS